MTMSETIEMAYESDVERTVQKLLGNIRSSDQEAVSEWILQKRADGKSKSTIESYMYWISAVSKLSSRALLRCTKKDILNLLVSLREKYRNASLYCHALRDFLRHHDKEVLASIISLNSKKSKREWQDPAKVLNRSDVSQMLGVTNNVRDKAIIALLWDTGARVHEIASVQIEDLERGKNVSSGKSSVLYTLWFRKQKVAGEERRIPLYESSQYVLKWLRAHPRPDDKGAPLFPSKIGGGMLTGESIRAMTHRAGGKARIDKRAHPHAFRHGRATDLKMRGVSDDAIRAYMGWVRDSDMPMRYISRTQQDQMNEVASKLGYEPMPEPGPVKELEADDLLPPPIEVEELESERFDQLSKEMEELREASARNEARFDTLFDHLARQTPSITTDPKIVREQMQHASWIDNDMEGVDDEEGKFLRGKLAEFERKRGQFLDKGRKDYWQERGRNTDGEED